MTLGDPRRLGSRAWPPIPPTWRWRWPRSTRSCTRRGRTASARSSCADLHRLPGDEPERDTVLEHGELITAVDVPPMAFAAQLALPQGARPCLVRVRPGLGRRGARRRRRSRPRRAPRAWRRGAQAVACDEGRGRAARCTGRPDSFRAAAERRAGRGPAVARQRLQGAAGPQRHRQHVARIWPGRADDDDPRHTDALAGEAR